MKIDPAKRYALERAIDVYKTRPEASTPSTLTYLADSFYGFLTSDAPLAQIKESGGVTTSPAKQRTHLIEHRLGDITSQQRHILKACIILWMRGDKCSGAALGREVKQTQSNVSTHLRKLEKAGYVRRLAPTRYQPLFHPSGEEVSAVIRKLPAGNARGYKPTLQDVKSAARK